LTDPQTGSVIEFCFREITVNYAHQLLGRNFENNRALKDGIVNTYAKTIENGLFKVANGESIKMSDRGALIDGQHRLEAVIKSGVSQTMLVIKGIPHDNLLSLDSGVKRSLADALRITGDDYGYRLTSVASGIRMLDNLAYSVENDIVHNAVSGARKRAVRTNEDLIIFASRVPQLREVIGRFHQQFKYGKIEKCLPMSISIALFYLYGSVNSEVTFSIFKTLENRGFAFDGKGASSPAFQMYTDIMDRKVKSVRIRSDDYIRVFSWCFDAMMTDDFKKYRWNTDKSEVPFSTGAGCKQIKDKLHNMLKGNTRG